MKYQGWKFEKTALVTIDGVHPRENALLNVTLRIPTHHAVNIENALRVVAKPEWNRYGRELPFQIHGLKRQAEETEFSVAFRPDLQPGVQNRFGFLYANETARPNDLQSDLGVSRGEGNSFTVDAMDYHIRGSAETAMPEYLMLKLHYLEGTFPKDIITPALPQQGVLALLDVNGKPVEVNEANALETSITAFESGPIFTRISKRCLLGPANGEKIGADLPVLETDYFFYCGQPLYSVHTRLHFAKSTSVYRVAQDAMTVADTMFSHYTFRPVSKSLPTHDLEEMAHVLTDPAYTSEMPDGPLMGSLIPGDIAWQSFIRIHKGSRVSRYAHTRISLTAPQPDGITYQSATILEKNNAEGTISACRYPVYVRNIDNPANALTLEAGTTFAYSSLHSVQKWDEEGFADKIESIGKQMNTPPVVHMHPQLPFAAEQKNVPALHPFYGNYHAAYTHPGVR